MRWFITKSLAGTNTPPGRREKMTAIRTIRAIQIAEAHIGKGSMVSSAILCLDDAKHLYAEGREEYAHARALKSISYSVGIMHPAYKAASE